MICKDNGAGIYQKHALDWSQILGAIKHPVYVIDAHSHDIVAANRRLKVLQSEGRCKCYDVLHGFDVPCTEKGVACPMELVRASGKPAVVEHEHLAINARDALEEGNGSIMVSAKNVVLQRAVEMIGAVCPVGTYVMLQVADNGCGIPESLQRRIFEPFFTTKPKDKGTGLGLSVVYNIIRSHNGFLNLTSESGKGTQFDIYLPALLE